MVVFMGCGWRFPFMFGVAKYIQEQVQVRTHPGAVTIDTYAGASGGSLIAYALQAGIDVREVYESALSKRGECPYAPLGMCDLLESVARRHATTSVPQSGKLNVIAAKVGRWLHLTPEYFTEFESVDDMCKCLRASSHIPVFGGSLMYAHRGNWYVDGELGATIEQIRALYETRCIIVDFCDKADIKPTIPMPRWWSYRPQRDAVMDAMFRHGYDRAESYFSHKG